jgi:hypothetical protein
MLLNIDFLNTRDPCEGLMSTETFETTDYKGATKRLSAMLADKNLQMFCTPIPSRGGDDGWSQQAAHLHVTLVYPKLSATHVCAYSVESGIWSNPDNHKNPVLKAAIKKAGRGWINLHANALLMANAKAAYRPEPLDVVVGLLMDANYSGVTFDSWCHELGYNTDSRRAFAIYEESQKAYDFVVKLFGVQLEEALSYASQI